MRIRSRNLSSVDQRLAVQQFRKGYTSVFGFFPEQSIRTLSRVTRDTGGLHPPRLIIPYSFVWGQARLASVIAQITDRHAFLLGLDRVSVDISWSLGHRHLLKVLKALNGEFHSNLELFQLDLEARCGF